MTNRKTPHQIGDTVHYRRTKYTPPEPVTVIGVRGNGGVAIGWMDGALVTKRNNLKVSELWMLQPLP